MTRPSFHVLCNSDFCHFDLWDPGTRVSTENGVPKGCGPLELKITTIEVPWPPPPHPSSRLSSVETYDIDVYRVWFWHWLCIQVTCLSLPTCVRRELDHEPPPPLYNGSLTVGNTTFGGMDTSYSESSYSIKVHLGSTQVLHRSEVRYLEGLQWHRGRPRPVSVCLQRDLFKWKLGPTRLKDLHCKFLLLFESQVSILYVPLFRVTQSWSFFLCHLRLHFRVVSYLLFTRIMWLHLTTLRVFHSSSVSLNLFLGLLLHLLIVHSICINLSLHTLTFYLERDVNRS